MYAVHHDDSVAQAAGLPSIFSVGMLHAGLLASWATDWLGPENVRRFRVRFKEQVWLGDFLTCAGTVSRVYVEAHEQKIDLELSWTRQTGGLAAQAWATFVLNVEVPAVTDEVHSQTSVAT